MISAWPFPVSARLARGWGDVADQRRCYRILQLARAGPSVRDFRTDVRDAPGFAASRTVAAGRWRRDVAGSQASGAIGGYRGCDHSGAATTDRADRESDQPVDRSQS